MSPYQIISGNNQHTFHITAEGPLQKPQELWSLKNFEAKSAPLVHNKVLYISQNKAFYAIDADSGNTLWKIQLPGQATAPTVVGNVLYLGGHYIDNHLYAVDIETGKELWKFRTGTNNSGVHRSPILEDDKIVFTAGNTLYAIDPNSAKAVWKYKLGDKASNIPVVLGDGKVFATALNPSKKTKLYGVDIHDGREVYKTDLPAQPTSHLLFLENHILYIDLDNNLNIINPTTGKTNRIKLVEGTSIQTRTFLAYGDEEIIVVVGHMMASLNIISWTWSWTLKTKGTIGQPVIAKGIIYVATCFDGVYAFDLKSGQQLFHTETDVRSQYACGVADGVLYLAGSMNEHELTAYKV